MRELETARTNQETKTQPSRVTRYSFQGSWSFAVSRNYDVPTERPPRRKVGKILAGAVTFLATILVPFAKLLKEIRGLFS